MAKYRITIDTEELNHLFNQDQGMAKLLERESNKQDLRDKV